MKWKNKIKKKRFRFILAELPLVSILRFNQREDRLSPLILDLLGLDSQRQPSAGAGGWSDDETTRNPRCQSRDGPPSVSFPALEKRKKKPKPRKIFPSWNWLRTFFFFSENPVCVLSIIYMFNNPNGEYCPGNKRGDTVKKRRGLEWAEAAVKMATAAKMTKKERQNPPCK